MRIAWSRWSMGVLCAAWLHASFAQVNITGAMRNTLFNGQLAGLIAMDSLQTAGTYGLGPLAYLGGEVMLWDGVPFVSVATSDSTMDLSVRPAAQAPFFVHARVNEWKPIELPDSVVDLATLDAFLTDRLASRNTPVAFRLTGVVEQAEVHIVDLPPGSEVHSPEDAHQGRKSFTRKAVQADLLGFFSTRHKAVFTHHDTNIHIHLIDADRKWMGHVDGLHMEPTVMRLFVAVP